MEDREMLELSAKAAGIDYGWQHIFDDYEGSTSEKWDWNPLTEDGDALRLSVKLNLQIVHYLVTRAGFDRVVAGNGNAPIKYEGDACAATRRAIVRAAAEIGRSMK